MSSGPDPKSPDDAAPAAPEAIIEPERAAPAEAARVSGSVDVTISNPELPPQASGSIDVAMSIPDGKPIDAKPVDAKPIDGKKLDGVPVVTTDVDSAPVSSGRVTSMHAAATGPTDAPRAKRITEGAREVLERGVETIGGGIETIGEGVSKLADASKSLPLVGAGVARLGEGITSVGESITDLPRVARTRRGRLVVRSVVVGLVIVSTWIVAIAFVQMRRTDSTDFRPNAEYILGELSHGRAAIEALWDHASPRFQEMVRKERFVDDMLDLHATIGNFVEITAINESIVTSGPAGRIGRVSLSVAYTKGVTRASVSLHDDEGEWKLLGVGVEVPADVKITNAQREERIAACKLSDQQRKDLEDKLKDVQARLRELKQPKQKAEIADLEKQRDKLQEQLAENNGPMDAVHCKIHKAANAIFEQLRDGKAGAVWDAASPDVFQKQITRARFVQIQTEHQAALGQYRRVIAVTEARVITSTSCDNEACRAGTANPIRCRCDRGTFDVLVEYSRANVRAIFGFIRQNKEDDWQLRSLKVALPMPRSDDLRDDAGSGSGKGSATKAQK